MQNKKSIKLHYFFFFSNKDKMLTTASLLLPGNATCICIGYKHAKKNEANIQLSYRTSLVNKGFIIGKFFLRDTGGSPERAR